MRLLAAPAAAALVVVLSVPAPAAAQHAGGAPGGHSPPRTRMTEAMPLPRSSPLAAALPETTLARVFFAKGRTDIGITDLRRAALKLGESPESLTPQATREVLGLLVQQAILTHKVREEPRRWTAADSTEYRVLTDRLTLGAAMDSAIVELGWAIAARGDSVPDKETLGIMVRDSSVAKLAPRYDEEMFEKLMSAFSALPRPSMDLPVMERVRRSTALPSVSAQDSARSLVAWGGSWYTTGQLLTDLGRIAPTRRPQVKDVAGLHDVVRNQVYVGLLREAARAQGLAHRPRVVAQLAERAEFLDLQRYVTRNIYDLIPVDSTTLRTHYTANRARFQSPARAVVVQTVFDRQEDADTLAHRLTVPGFAESLATRSALAGISYQVALEEDTDLALFDRMRRAGEGAVIGPDSVAAGWRVLKVMSLAPRRDQAFETAYAGVRTDWLNREGERRMRELIGKLSVSTLVRTNDTSPWLTGRKRTTR